MPRVSSSASRASSPSSRARSVAAEALAATARSCAAARSASARSARSRAFSRRAAAARSASIASVRLARAAASSASSAARRSAAASACSRFLGRAPLDLGQAAPRRVDLGLAGGRRPTQRRQLLAVGLARRPQGPELGEGVGQLAFGLAEGRLQIEVARRDRRGQRAPSGRQLGLGRGTLVERDGVGRARAPRDPR